MQEFFLSLSAEPCSGSWYWAVAGRSLAREVWSRIGLLRWIALLIVVVVFLDLADGAVNR